MKFERETLVDVLNKIKPALSKRAIIEQTTHYVFTGWALAAFNDQICIIHPCETDFVCSVPSDEFMKILNGITSKEIELSFEKNKLHISAGDVNAALATDSGEFVIDKIEDLKIDKIMKKKVDLPTDFIEAVSMCMFSASKDATKPERTCLLIEDKYVASTDGYRISEYKMKSSTKASILIPATSVAELVKYDIKSFYTDEKSPWIYFFTEDKMIFCSRMIDAEYPDYVKFMEDIETKEIKLPKDTKRLITTSSILAEGEIDIDKEIEVSIVKNELRCKGQNEKGWVTGKIKIDYKGENISFIINPMFFDKILNHTDSMYYGENRIMFKDKNFKHVISLSSKE